MLLDTDTLCNDDDVHKIKIDLFEFKREGAHKLLGSTTTCLDEFKKGKKSFKIGGMKINITSFEMRRSASFLEYIFGGC